ncbi:MAG: exodeoxyribonuclease VII small subunit [Victivallaceae bacterium]|nr:exodeoxyribonuclease VII small subunit [Victivallaceae bacterium]
MSEEIQKKDDELTFEQALAKLETLVARMETGRQPIEEMMKDFECGSHLVKSCRAKLDVLERKIELLTADDGKQGEWTPFDADNSRHQ